MPNLQQIVYLSAAEYNTLVTNGTLTKNGRTITYNADSLYITPEYPTIEFIVSTNMSSSASLTGVLSNINTITDGKIIYYFINFTLPSSAQTLTLTYGNTEDTTGAIPLYLDSSTPCALPFTAGTILNLVYYNQKFFVVNNGGVST